MKKEYSDDLVVRMAHHSTAIEGNTLTQGETKSILIDDIIPRQMGNREFYEVFNYRNFIKYLDKNYKENLDFALKNAHSKEEKIGAIMESHLRFEHIHPFSDGNGRVGRALIVLYCLKENIPPIVIEKEQREQYIAALNNEDKKELRNLGIELSEKERIRQKLIKGMIRERQRGEVER